MDRNCNKLANSMGYVNLMEREWVRLTLSTFGTQSGIFLAACRHLLDQQQQHYYSRLAIQYKLYCLQALQKAISSEITSLISDATFGISILMAYDEVRRMQRFLFQIEPSDVFLETLVAAQRYLHG